MIVCGIFWNLANEAELNRLLRNLSFLSQKGSSIILTRGDTEGIRYSDTNRIHESGARIQLGILTEKAVSSPSPVGDTFSGFS